MPAAARGGGAPAQRPSSVHNQVQLQTIGAKRTVAAAWTATLPIAIVASNSVFSSIDGAIAANDDVGQVAMLIQQGF